MALTRYKEGSFRELISLSLPLMISAFSMTSMLFVDRLLLARYSNTALNGVVEAVTLGWAIVFGWFTLTGIAEVFVAQYNGAGRKDKLGEPVWQMIWLSLASLLFFVPFAIWGSPLIYHGSAYREMQQEYFRNMLLFGWAMPLYGALASFWIGRGKTALISWLAIGANIINAVLDWVLIFGVEGWVPSLGVKGAAIATNIGATFQAATLLFLFLRKKHRDSYGTGKYQFNFSLFSQCLRVGAPNGIFQAIEIFGWAVFYSMMTKMGQEYISVVGITQSIVIFLWFVIDGIQKGAMTIAGNVLGAGRPGIIPKVLKTGTTLIFVFFFLTLGGVLLFHDFISHQFLDIKHNPHHKALLEPLRFGLICISVYLLLEGLRCLIGGLLTAAGDTFFLLIAGSLSVWVFLVLPVYLFVVVGGATVHTAALIAPLYSLVACAIYLFRFSSGKWKNISLLQPQQTAAPVLQQA